MSFDHEKFKAERTRERLAERPESQVEAVAEYHMAIATTAFILYGLFIRKRGGAGSPDVDRTIEFLMDRIKKAHLDYLGIPLEWPEEKERMNNA